MARPEIPGELYDDLRGLRLALLDQRDIMDTISHGNPASLRSQLTALRDVGDKIADMTQAIEGSLVRYFASWPEEEKLALQGASPDSPIVIDREA